MVEATLGHIKDLPKSKLGVDIENNFKPYYEVVEKRQKEIKNLISQAKKASGIFLATDPDREGEAIALHVREVLEKSKFPASPAGRQIPNSKFKRIIFHEITQSAVEEAIRSPRKVDKNLVDAQIARRVLDRLVGYKLSPLLWKKVRRGLSAGRVQSVAVRLIVEKEKEIEAFKKEEYWEIWVNVKCQKPNDKREPFTIQLIKINDKKAEIKDGDQAKRIVSDLEEAAYKVFDVRRREVRKNPYPPFTTSTMTQGAARLFGWSAKPTINVAQKLYEEGLITYHRTDSVNLAIAAVTKARDYISRTYGVNYLPEKPRFFKRTSKLAQEAHEAIRPTYVDRVVGDQWSVNGKFGNDGKKLYELIWRRFVACQMEASVYDETVIDVEANTTPEVKGISTSGVYILRVSGQVMKFDGWRKIFGKKEGEEAIVLPKIEKDETLDLIKVLSEQKFTQPPARFNEASLIKTLEKLGIGRPSTYAPIITTIQLRQYVEKDEGKFKPTPVGVAVNEFLVKNFPDVFEYSFTAEMESNLDKVAEGEKDWQKMMKDFYNPFEKIMVKVEKQAKRVKIEAEKLNKKCPECKKGELVVRVGRFGKFISCSRFPDCKYTNKYEDRIGMKCPDCKTGNVIVKTTKKGRKFYGCSRYPKCKWASWRKPGQEGKKG